MSRIRNLVRYTTLTLIIAGGVWLLIPPKVEEDSTGGGQAEAAAPEVKYVIKFAPGQPYMPDTIPLGIGQPLQGLKRVIREFEKQFSDTKVEVVVTPGRREYLVTQLSSGRAPDIVAWNVEDVWVDIQKGWYVPLDKYLEAPNQFVRDKGDPTAPGYDQWWDMLKYQAVSRGKAAPDGLNYCLTFDMVETGIFYNKNIFRAAGVEVPEDWEQFLDVMAKIDETTGKIPLVMVIDWFNDWTTDLLFDQLYNGLLPGIDLVQDPVREQYLEGYLDWDELCFLYQKGFFSREDPRYVELWQHMKDMRLYCNKNLTGVDPTREFVTQEAAMLWNTSQMTYRLSADKDLEFEWGVFYLPPFNMQTSEYASLVDMCVIGGSATQLEVTNSAIKDTGDPETSERLKRVIELLQFLTLPENYERIVNEYACFVPNIVGVPVLPSLKPFEEILERRYTTTKWVFTFDLKFSEIQRRMLELYLNNGTTLDGFMDWQEDNLKNATDNLLMRKEVDMEKLERRWRELAPVRAGMKGLPPAVVESDKEILPNG